MTECKLFQSVTYKIYSDRENSVRGWYEYAVKIYEKTTTVRWTKNKVFLILFVWFDSLRPINNLSVIKGRVFLGWTSTELGLMFLPKDTAQLVRLDHAAPPLNHWATALQKCFWHIASYPLPKERHSNNSFEWIKVRKRAKIRNRFNLVPSGGVLWYYHTYVGSAHLFGFKILNFNIFLGFQKNEYFWGVWRFCGYFFGSSQNWARLRVISMQFMVFFKVKVQIGIFFGVA